MNSGILQEYIEYCKGTEPPVNFHRWSFLTCVGACLGRRIYLPFGDGYVYPNVYIMLVGSPGTRKTAAISRAKSLLSSSGYGHFAYSKSSKQKFLSDWQTGFDAVNTKDGKIDYAAMLDKPLIDEFKEAFVCNDEFIDFIGINNIDFINLITNLWEYKDEKYEERFKNSLSVSIRKPTLNILAGMTPTGIQQALPQESIGQGFLSRFIMVYGEPTKNKITWPRVPTEDEKEQFIKYFARIKDMSGKLILTSQSMDLVDHIYQSWEQLEDSRLTYYGSRRLAHLLKLVLILSACHETLHVTPDIIEEANSILVYTEQNMDRALGEFGKSKYSDVMQKLMGLLENANGPMTPDELYKGVATDLDRQQDLYQILRVLLKTEKIQTTENNDSIILSPRKYDRTKYTDFGKYIQESHNATKSRESHKATGTEGPGNHTSSGEEDRAGGNLGVL